MIDIPIIDTHLHLWDPSVIRYPWLEDQPTLARPHLVDDYNDATHGFPIEKMVFIQCEADFSLFREEAEWVTQQAEHDSRISGIVAWAPLERGEKVKPILEDLCTAFPLLRGIRRIIEFEDDVQFCLQPDFIEGVKSLAQYNLSFDICIKGNQQFENTLSLVRQCPEVTFILDHIGKPFIYEGTQIPWNAQIKEIARCHNSFCKVSGLLNEADGETRTLEHFQPYLDTVFESFGLDRLIFGGDWPVCTLAGTLSSWLQIMESYTQNLAREDKKNIFYDNALSVYRL